MNAAFKLLSSPPARSRVRNINSQRRARLTPDARISSVVEGQQRNCVRLRVRLNVLHRPACQWTYFAKTLARGQFEGFDFNKIRARRRLLEPQRRKPHVVLLQGGQ